MMSLQETAPSPEGSVEAPLEIVQAPDKLDNVRAAARLLAEHRATKRRESQPAEAAEAPAEEIPLEEGDSPVPIEEPQAETQATDPVVEEPPSIEPPRSWTSEDKETFKALPPATQARLVELDRTRELEVRKGQNEVAEQRKALEVEAKAAAAQRKQYETALPILLKTMQTTGDFADIKSVEDIVRLAAEDPLRYTQWDAHQKKVAMLHHEVEAAQQREAKDKAAHWEKFYQREDQLLAESLPEAKDPEKWSKLRHSAVQTLKGIGYSEQELAELWETPTFRDHRIQRLIVDATKLREAREKQRSAPPKVVPPVQPGPARAPGAEKEAVIKALEQRLEKTGSLRDAAAMRAAQRAGRR
jgi:hypothetical protein